MTNKKSLNPFALRTLILCLLSTGFISCSIFNNDDKTTPEVPESIELSVSYPYGVVDSKRAIRIRPVVTSNLGNTLPNDEVSILVDGENKGLLTEFNSTYPDMFELQARIDDLTSNIVTVEIRPQRTFTQKEFQIIFHVVHDGEPLGQGYNISKEQIDYQMDLLRKVYENPLLSLTPNSSYAHLSFELAEKDPWGNVLDEPGINRLRRPSTEETILFQNWMWDHYWDPDYYINVWVGDTKSGYSWGIYPSTDCDHPLDGMNCTGEEVPFAVEGVALELENLWEGNWVFPHEIGHLLGLFHVFSSINCISDPDYSNDTYYYNRQLYESGISSEDRTACTGETYTSYNIMDYWNQPETGRDLTYDQRERIRHIVDHGRFRASKNPETGTPRDMSQFKPEEPSTQQKKAVQ